MNFSRFSKLHIINPVTEKKKHAIKNYNYRMCMLTKRNVSNKNSKPCPI